MFDNYDLENLFLSILLIVSIVFIILLVFCGIVAIFTDFGQNQLIEIKYNDGNLQTYRKPSLRSNYESYLEFYSEGIKYTIFYKDIKSVREYRENAKGIYSTRK